MSTEQPPPDLVLEMLRAIRATLAQHTAELREIKGRLTSLDRSLAGLALDRADANERYDRLVERVDRIEERLNLRDQ